MDRERSKILIAVDGSEQVYELVDYVSSVIPALETEVVLFHIMGKVPDTLADLEKIPLTPEHLDHLKRWELDREKQVRDTMRAVRLKFVEIGIPEYSTMISIQKVKEGIARDLLVEAQRGYDAVVVGRGRAGEAGSQLLGSVAAKMAAKLSPANLWLIGRSPLKGRVLIAVDRSDPAMRAVAHVGRMINSSILEIELLHVVRGISVSAAAKEKIFPEEYRQRLLEEAENQIRPAFDEAVDMLADAGIQRERVSTKVISGVASRAGAIFDEAAREGYGTVVVGRKGLSEIVNFDMGRVTGKLVHLLDGQALWIAA